MKPEEFKKILKPLVKQTVKEVILEEGILSNIVAEVARGLTGDLVVEARAKKAEVDYRKESEDLEQQRQEKIKKLNESSKFRGAFSGTQEMQDSNSRGPLSGVSPGDRGVDITAIQKIANGKWKQLI